MIRFESYIAARYLRGKRKNRFVNLITVISIAGVSVGVIALIVVLSVMTGFDIALRDTIIGNRAHVIVSNLANTPMMHPDEVEDEVMNLCPQVVAAGPIMQVEALLSNEKDATGGYIIGIDPKKETEVTMFEDNLSDKAGRTWGRGDLPKEKEIVLGYRLANRIGATVGSTIGVITANPTVTPFGVRQGNKLWLRVSGISQAKMSDFDQLYCFVDIDTARMLTGREGVDGIHLKLKDAFLADEVKSLIESNTDYRAITWYESQEGFFQALAQEKMGMFIILVFIVLVATFNITSTLIMIVMEKRRDIGILRTLGASGASILTIFIVEGLFIGLSGTIIGLVLGILIAQNINVIAEYIAGLFGLDLFNSTIYYFDGIPVAIIPWDICWITVSAVLLTFLSTIYPALSAVRVNPVEALRHE